MSKKLTPEERQIRREKNAEKARKWRAEHPGYSALHKSAERKAKHAEYMRKWYAKYPGANYGNVKQWRAENKEKWLARAAEYAKKRRQVDPEKWKRKDREFDLRRKYGVTPEWYEAKLVENGGGCEICGRTEKIAGRNHPVDHSHVTGKTRGILCHHCNVSLHKVETIPGWIQKAAAYLKLYE